MEEKMEKIRIAFEGPDGSGKTVSIEIFKKFLEAKSITVSIYKEPYKQFKKYETIQKLLKENIESELLVDLFSESREVLEKDIEKDENKIILLDRSIVSTIVYQFMLRNKQKEIIHEYINRFSKDMIPNFVFLLIPSFKVLQERLDKRKEKDHIERDEARFKKVVEYYREVHQYFPNTEFINKIQDIKIL